MIPIAKPLIGEEEKRAVLDVLKSGMLAQGKKVEEFEYDFADYIGVNNAIAVSNGTTALHTALLAHGIKGGDEIITTPFSFIASSNSILFCNAKPVFVDIDESFNINPELIEEKINDRTRGIIPVHLFGTSCEMGKIMRIARKNNLIVIEDACQSVGASFNEKKVGSIGNSGCFSFYPTKNMTTIEGGMITTNDEKVAERARMIRDHGMKERYKHKVLGYNYRMDEVRAAIGMVQLKRLEEFNKKRISNAKYLDKNLNIKGIIKPEIKESNVFNLYTIRIGEEFPVERDKVLEELRKNEIGAVVYYHIPIHKQDLYKKLGYDEELLNAQIMAEEVISLPVHPSVTKNDLDFIIYVLGGLK